MSRRDLWEQVDGDLYALLGVPSDADADALQVAWRSTAKRLHPDRGGSVTDFQQAEIAYEVLSDPLERGRYDRMRRQNAGQHSGTQAGPRYAYMYTYAPGNARTATAEEPYFNPNSADPYGDAARRNSGRRRNPWLIALAIVLGICAFIAAVALALVTFLVLLVAVSLFVGRVLTGRNGTK